VRNRAGKTLPGARVSFFGQKDIEVERNDGARWDSPSYTGELLAVSDGSGRYATEVDAGLTYSVRVTVAGVVDERGRLKEIAALTPGESREYNPVCDTDSILVRATFVGQQSGQPFTHYVPVISRFDSRCRPRRAPTPFRDGTCITTNSWAIFRLHRR
jgi:hypothetical protein